MLRAYLPPEQCSQREVQHRYLVALPWDDRVEASRIRPEGQEGVPAKKERKPLPGSNG